MDMESMTLIKNMDMEYDADKKTWICIWIWKV